MTDSGVVTTVFFDLGGTLVRVERTVGDAYVGVAARHGVRASAVDVERNFRHAWRRSVERSVQRGHVCSDEILREEWMVIVRESFGDALPLEKAELVFDDLYGHFAAGRAWVVADGAMESLRSLRRRGVKLAILSNWDSRIEQTLLDLGLAELFDELIVSHAVGYEKPHPEIFHSALRTTGARAERCLHVGDSLEADIRPARALGMRTLWVNPEAESEARAKGVGPRVADLCLSEEFWNGILREP